MDGWSCREQAWTLAPHLQASAINRAYAARDREYPLYITSGKSACGHSLDCSGVQLFIKNLRMKHGKTNGTPLQNDLFQPHLILASSFGGAHTQFSNPHLPARIFRDCQNDGRRRRNGTRRF
eukprot:3701762-Amphidinium_carterae.1